MWEHIGRMLVQGLDVGAPQTGEQEASWSSVHSRLMMTDPALTMAAGDAHKVGHGQRQRQKLTEIAFESLGVSEFSLQPAQLPMIMSELVMDGIVVDLGHEMTQIVPVFEGMTDTRKARTFHVGGITMDAIFMKNWGKERAVLKETESKFNAFRARTKFKEELLSLAELFPPGLQTDEHQGPKHQLPDGAWFEVNWWKDEMHPIDAYLKPEKYEQWHTEFVRPLFTGKSTKQMHHARQPNFEGVEIVPPEHYPPISIQDETLRSKIVESPPKFPVTNALFRTIREYCEDEEIKDFDRL